tara:strand:- start:422 stop:604 length:183 start_codon:yes stop_codon:yes gene_type:complete
MSVTTIQINNKVFYPSYSLHIEACDEEIEDREIYKRDFESMLCGMMTEKTFYNKYEGGEV